ncbi:DUF2231 domain-containing protein [Nocardioides sp.]|uniref:DUF2231 domain-containing protein n=1 Tax=Nocardioides sp. TaxID=35761 RepID=UPI00261EC892|nr:DUF2231 domain-containing protein [Nocardioides sp.]
MFDTFNGLPVHPLVVHAVVVLLPLAILGTIALVLRPSWRRHYGWPIVAIAAVATALIPVATSSGESLEKKVGDPGRHAALGDQLIWFAIPLLVLLLVWVLLGRRTPATERPEGQRGTSAPAAVTWVVAILALVAAVAAGVQVYRVGDSGAKAAWGDVGQGG